GQIMMKDWQLVSEREEMARVYLQRARAIEPSAREGAIRDYQSARDHYRGLLYWSPDRQDVQLLDAEATLSVARLHFELKDQEQAATEVASAVKQATSLFARDRESKRPGNLLSKSLALQGSVALARKKNTEALETLQAWARLRTGDAV